MTYDGIKIKIKKKSGPHSFYKNTFLEKPGSKCQTEPPSFLRIKTLTNLNLIRLVRSLTNCYLDNLLVHWLKMGHSQLLACWLAVHKLLTRSLAILYIYK